MKYIQNINDDTYYNLALEEYVFNHFKDDIYLLLWKNDNSIVLGKHQNVFEEINIKAVEEMGIKVARRNTGGGTVFHDKGNLNYSFMADYNPNSFIDYDTFLNPIISALESMGIHAVKRRTCDIAIDDKKISGSAQTIKGGRILHHGTLLFDSDLPMLIELLKKTEGKIVSKAIKSVTSTVTNIKEHIYDKTMTIDEFKALLLKDLFKGGAQEITLSEEQLVEIRELVENKYSKWQWNYGNSPKFSYEKERKVLGEAVNVKLNVEKGIVVSCEITGNKLPYKDIERIVIGSRYSYNEIASKLEEIKTLSNIKNIDIEELTSCFF